MLKSQARTGKRIRIYRRKNYPVFIKHLDHKDFGPMFLVRLPPTMDKEEARRNMVKLQADEKLQPTIIVPNTSKE